MTARPLGTGTGSGARGAPHRLPLHRDRVRASSFGEDAALYDRARPRYPLELVADLLAGQPRHLLDVGCGTGIAARQFAAAGLDVVGVEPDPRMAAVARRHGLVVEDGTFETWDPAGRSFDLLISAQAWHWVDPEAGAAKAARVVRAQGRIGLFWNLGRPPGALQQRFDDIYATWAPGVASSSVLLGRGDVDRHPSAFSHLRRSAAWEGVEVRRYPFDVGFRTEDWIDYLQTHSDHRGLPPGRLRPLLDRVGATIDDAGGSFVMHYETALVTATRAS